MPLQTFNFLALLKQLHRKPQVQFLADYSLSPTQFVVVAAVAGVTVAVVVVGGGGGACVCVLVLLVLLLLALLALLVLLLVVVVELVLAAFLLQTKTFTVKLPIGPKVVPFGDYLIEF